MKLRAAGGGNTATRPKKPLVLTGADHRFARTLWQFLLSAERHGEHRHSDWVVYDIGMSHQDRTFLQERFGWAQLRSFPFESYPPHVALASGSYAWKPLIIKSAAESSQSPIFWFDSATVLKAPLDEPLQALSSQGFWALRSQMPLEQKCDPRVMAALEVPAEVRHIREYAAGSVGFDPAMPLGRQLIEDWARHALVADHIIPKDYAHFHKHDQAVLNCLLAKAAFEGNFEGSTTEIDISSANPTTVLSTRNFVPDRFPLWADALLRCRQAIYKGADRLYHRVRRFDDTRIDGWRRRRKEHFSVVLQDLASGRKVSLQGPRNGYYADPFIWQREGKIWLFVEEFVYAKDRGHLTALGLDHNLAVISAEPLALAPSYAALDCHASFPFIFEHGGETYMIPETHERRSVDLFVCESWPRRWRLVRRLLSGIDAVDTMAIQDGGNWYLATSVGGAGPHRHLEIYHARGLLSGYFEPHPINNRGIFGDKVFGTGRNAGFIGRQSDGSLARLMQDSTHYYGESLRPMKIIDLSPTSFAETPADELDYFPGIRAGFPSHHASRSGDILAYDTRDRA